MKKMPTPRPFADVARDVAAARAETPMQGLAEPPSCVLPDGSIDHEWEFQDDSFDHAFGTERVHYFACVHCGETRGMEPGDYHEDDDYYV